ncbi:MAG: hypothetical protein NTW21_28460 [Verrucomicrobia bacterium]|nr:hypothetical protein [Verrucomicrobiota bacterium]
MARFETAILFLFTNVAMPRLSWLIADPPSGISNLKPQITLERKMDEQEVAEKAENEWQPNMDGLTRKS